MKSCAIGVLWVATLAVTDAASAAEGGLEIIPTLGRGELVIDADQVVTSREEDVDTVAVGVTLDYVTPVGLTLEIGGMRQRSDNAFGAFDDFRLDTGHIALAWTFETSRGFRVVPKVGVAHWKLYSREGRLFNPGPEATSAVDGDDYFWELTLSQRITPRISLGGSYRDPNFGFGEARSLSFVASFGL